MGETIRIQSEDGPIDVEAERVVGCWALHRAYGAAAPDRWTVTWTVSGHGLGDGSGRAKGLPRDVAERLLDLVSTEWPHWPRRREHEPVTIASKKRAIEALRRDVEVFYMLERNAIAAAFLPATPAPAEGE